MKLDKFIDKLLSIGFIQTDGEKIFMKATKIM